MGINFRTTCAAALWQSYYSARLRYFTAAEWQTRVVMDIFGCFAETVRRAAREGEWRHARVQVFQTQALERSAMGSGNRVATTPSALQRSSLRRFGTCPYRPIPRGLPSSFMQLEFLEKETPLATH